MERIRTPLAALCLALAACGDEPAHGPDEAARPNLLLVSVDTLRPDHLGCYGYERPTSPHMDALAEAGVLFEDVSSVSPWTLPSHATLLTGLYPSRHGVKAHTRRLEDDVPSLATRLAAAGYATMAVVNSHNLSARYGLDQGFQRFEYVEEYEHREDGAKSIPNRGPRVASIARSWLAEPDARPFFLFLHFYDVHTDLTPQSRFERMFKRPYKGQIDGTTQQLRELRHSGGSLRETDVRRLFDLYDAEIRELDQVLGELLAFVDERGLADETLVVLTSDHGEEFMEHGSVLHGRTYYQEVIGIPLLLRGPGVPAGLRVAQPASLVDVFPTVLALLGFEPEEALDGIDLSAHWRGVPPAERFLFAEADHNVIVDGERRQDVHRMVRRGAHKLLFHRLDSQATLFDLEADPGEREDRAAADPDRTQALLERVLAFLATEREGEEIEGPDAEALELLEALGY